MQLNPWSTSEIGSITPGRIADVLFVKDLRDFDIVRVIANGETVVKDRKYLAALKLPRYPDFMYGTIRLRRPITPDDLSVKVSTGKTHIKARIIVADGISLYTPERIARLKVVNGIIQPDPERDILRISMIDRHAATGEIGNAFVTGFKLAKGAIASSVSVLCQNIVAVGTNNEDMAMAVNHLSEVGGGHVVVADGKIVAELELPLLGLLSDAPLDRVVEKSSGVYQEIKKLGCPFASPLTTLAFCCACDEIGKVKLFQGGLIDAEKGEKVSVVVE
jgi:adenine deaminase